MLNWYKRWHTSILALLSFVMFVGSAIFIFDVQASQILNYFVLAIIITAMAVLSAGVFLVILRAFKKRQ